MDDGMGNNNWNETSCMTTATWLGLGFGVDATMFAGNISNVDVD